MFVLRCMYLRWICSLTWITDALDPWHGKLPSNNVVYSECVVYLSL